jgi:hypothetical protein
MWAVSHFTGESADVSLEAFLARSAPLGIITSLVDELFEADTGMNGGSP